MRRVRYPILGTCPACGSFRIGLIKVGDMRHYEKELKKFYRKHRALLRYADYREYEEGFSPNRFCWACKHEWLEDEGTRHKNRFTMICLPDEDSLAQFLQATEFDFSILYRDREKTTKAVRIKQMAKRWLRRRFF